MILKYIPGHGTISYLSTWSRGCTDSIATAKLIKLCNQPPEFIKPLKGGEAPHRSAVIFPDKPLRTI